jgi:hypothetical protein
MPLPFRCAAALARVHDLGHREIGRHAHPQLSALCSSGEGKWKSLRRITWNSTFSDASIAVPLSSPSPC